MQREVVQGAAAQGMAVAQEVVAQVRMPEVVRSEVSRVLQSLVLYVGAPQMQTAQKDWGRPVAPSREAQVPV